MYFNLASDFKAQEFDFQFAVEIGKLPKTQNDSGTVRPNIWYPVPGLFDKLKRTSDDDQVADEIIQELNIEEENLRNAIGKNVACFFRAVFAAQAIGIAKITLNRTSDASENKQRVVELFRRLNDGGTRLSGYDLVAAKLKGYDWQMESFLNDLRIYRSNGFGQDEILKLMFLLRDNYAKEMVDVEEEDAKFAVARKDRIASSLRAVDKFLQYAKLREYFQEGNRSVIPLYFVAYYAFHSPCKDADVENLFDQFDVGKGDFRKIRRWLYFSLLFGVFSRSQNTGWRPYTTGMRKILGVLSRHKGMPFPTETLFDMYVKHPLHHFKSSIDSSDLDLYDETFALYLMYDCQRSVRNVDKDHIHALSLLSDMGESFASINILANYQLLDPDTNRNRKRAKTLRDWIQGDVNDVTTYLDRHMIPTDEALWNPERYGDFKVARTDLIMGKLRRMLAA